MGFSEVFFKNMLFSMFCFMDFILDLCNRLYVID